MKTKFSTRMLALALILTLLVPMLVFQASAEDRVVTFNLGANGSAPHNDGTSATTYTETVDGYTLNITNGVKMFSGARDETGNGCLKLGTSSVVGSCQFTVPDDVTSVVLHVAKYKAKTSKIAVNGTTYTLTNSSNDGAYDEITVDTSTNKTVKITTVSGGVRAMLNSIDFVIAGGADSNEPHISLKGERVLQIGEPMTLTATTENITGDIAWSSNDETVATVDGGVVTGKKLGKATITASIGEVQATHEVIVYPKENSEITVGEALEIATFAGESGTPYSYKIMGTVKSIDDAYSEKYGNITVTIGDDTGSIYVYRMNGGENLLEGQTIIVCGRLQTYKNAPQVSQYSEYELVLDEATEAIVEALNKLGVKMSLAYRYETVETGYANSSFAFRFGADKALADIEGVASYGLAVSTDGKNYVYFSTDAKSWKVDEYCHVTVDLGDIINDLTKLSTKFTAKAYVEVDGVKYVSETEATYSVADMIKEYHGLGISEVTDLYDYLAENGLI